MIDIHTHILPDFDDGAANVSDAALMLRMAYESGTSDLVVTPHTINRFNEIEADAELIISEAYDKLCRLAEYNNIPLKLYYGAENFGSGMFVHGKNSNVITVNKTRYVLLEFDFFDSFDHVKYVVRKLTDMGYRIIIAHPERYEFVRQDPAPVHWFIEHGCCLQLNKGSAHGRFGRYSEIAANYILEKRLASFVASDAHDPFRRTPSLKNEYIFYCENYGKEYSDILFGSNARLMLSNEELQVMYR